MNGEGIPVSWHYPRTPGDINPYIITLRKVNTENYLKKYENSGTWPMINIRSISHESCCNAQKRENHIAALRRHHMLNKSYDLLQESHRCMTRGDHYKGPKFVYDKKGYCSRERILQPSNCIFCEEEKKHPNCCSRSFIKQLHMLDTPCNSSLWYKLIPKKDAQNIKQDPHIVGDRKERNHLEKNHLTHCKSCDDTKKKHNFCRKLSKELQKLKSDIENLKNSVQSVKNECSPRGDKRKVEVNIKKINNKLNRMKT